MDLSPSLLLLTSLVAAYLLSHFMISSLRRRLGRLPPGPHPFPIIGNIHHFGRNPHHTLTKLSKTYGPLMHLKMGARSAIVVSSPEIARNVLTKHDQAFSGRMTTAAVRALGHHTVSVTCLPAGGLRWRNLRRLYREQLFSAKRLEGSRGLRQEKLRLMVEHVREECGAGMPVDIEEIAFVTALNLLSSVIFSVDLVGYRTTSSKELLGVVRGLMEVMGKPNIADYFPFVGPYWDPQGIKGESEFYMGKLFKVFDGIIEGRLKSRVKRNDLLEVLLEINGGDESELSLDDMKHLLLDLFVAGTNTSSGAVVWAMAELLGNPTIMSKATNEIRTVLGQNKPIEESDLTNLPYLQSVIKETFRYHPPGPFLFRLCDQGNLQIDNFTIPKNALILINIWSMGRDSSVWENPDSFLPDRFLNSEIDVKGCDFELIPFGAGRRMCPGLPLAHMMVHLMLASLIQNFDWELERGVDHLDMSAKFGLSLQKATPLKIVPINLSSQQ